MAQRTLQDINWAILERSSGLMEALAFQME